MVGSRFMAEQKSLASAAPLFLVLFIDGMGLSLLFPIVNSIIIQQNSHMLAVSTPLSEREFLYGLIIGIYMICWFFGAAIMGDLSDASGRKKSLLLCLLGACIGYVLSGIAVNISSITLLVLGRVVAGFTAGSQPIAQAAIVDVSSEEHKARNIGYILFAVSLGFVIGPLIGGVLSDSKWVSWFNYSTPLYFAAIISLINAFLLQWLFKETHVQKERIKIRFSRAITVFIEAFRHHRIRNLSLVMLIMIFGWASYYTFIPLYLLEKYHYSTLWVSYFMATLGVGFGIGCGFIVDYSSRRFNNKTNVIVGCMVAALFVLLVVVVPSQIAAWFFTVVIGAAVVTAYSILITLFSDQVSEEEQGWVMGVTGSIMALCFGITSFLTGVVVEGGADLPLILSVIGLFLAGCLLVSVKLSSLAGA
jgi:DHA1 family tetracycline resistance protein-like MFS transporter